MRGRRHLKWTLCCLLTGVFLCPNVAAGTEIGVIFSGNIPYYRAIHVAFLDSLKQNSDSGDEVKFITMFPAPEPISLSNSANKLVVKGVDLIITYGFPATKAVLAQESAIPTLYVGLYDTGSLPSGKITGCGYTVPLTDLPEYFQQMTKISRLSLIYSHDDDDAVRQMKELSKYAEEKSLGLLALDLSSRKDLPKLNDLQFGDVAILTGSAAVHSMTEDIMASMAGKKIPAADLFQDSSNQAILLTLSPSPDKLGQSAAEMTAKIIAGEKAENIPPVLLSETELTLNLSVAKEMGLTPPAELTAAATKVVE